MGKLLLEPSHGPERPGQELRIVSCWTLNGASNDIVLTLSMLNTLIMPPWKSGGGEEGGEEEGTSKVLQSRYTLRADCELDYKHWKSACCIRVMHVHAGAAPGVVTRSGKAWARSSSCKPLGTERRLE
jgi:hypothetical protein